MQVRDPGPPNSDGARKGLRSPAARLRPDDTNVQWRRDRARPIWVGENRL